MLKYFIYIYTKNILIDLYIFIINIFSIFKQNFNLGYLIYAFTIAEINKQILQIKKLIN